MPLLIFCLVNSDDFCFESSKLPVMCGWLYIDLSSGLKDRVFVEKVTNRIIFVPLILLVAYWISSQHLTIRTFHIKEYVFLLFLKNKKKFDNLGPKLSSHSPQPLQWSKKSLILDSAWPSVSVLAKWTTGGNLPRTVPKKLLITPFLFSKVSKFE